MILYRIAKKQYAEDLTGEGARLFGGRWNSKGVPMVYTSESRSLAFAEMLVNTSMSLMQSMPSLFTLIAIHVSDKVIMEEIQINELPVGWNNYPHLSEVCQRGDVWAKGNTSLLLRVPSAVVKGEFNILLNPMHKDLKKIKIKAEGFPFDERLTHHTVVK
jgi:RES domain-containing protein